MMQTMLMGVVDGFGIYGNMLHYGIVVGLVGSALLIFTVLWKKGRLDMDEEPKLRMMQTDEEDPWKKTK